MSNAPANAPAPKKSSKMIWLVVCGIAIAAGYFYPKLTASPGKEEKAKEEKTKKEKGHGNAHPHGANIAFGGVVVNLAEDRMTRYIRVKIVLLVDEKKEAEAEEHINKLKPRLKSWLISHLSSKRLTEVAGSVGQERLKREIRDRFDEMLYPEGDDRLLEVLFEEFMVQ
jgi:flagellar basal body-associated protein FliL